MKAILMMLTKHSSVTVSTYGVRLSHTNHAVKSIDKENLDTGTSQNNIITATLESFLCTLATDPKAILDEIRRW